MKLRDLTPRRSARRSPDPASTRRVDLTDGPDPSTTREPADGTGDAAVDGVPGSDAADPREIPRRGWWQILRRAVKELGEDQGTLIAAGVAFYAFLAIMPTLIAATLLYGLVSDPAQVQQQVDSLSGALPEQARSLVQERMTALASAPGSGLGLGLVISLLLAFWSASGGVSALMQAVNDVYDEKDERSFVKRKGLALAMTVGAIVFFVLTVGLIAGTPAVLSAWDPPGVVLVAVEIARWLLLLLAVVVAVGVVYRLGPDRDPAKARWLSVGAVTATVVWVVATVGFSLYVTNFSSYDKTYGPLAGVVVVLLWLWLSVLAVLLGAEINAESEQQTVVDTTVGAPQPLGGRGAVKADSVPSTS